GKNRQPPDPIDREVEQFERRRIGPMQVLAYNQQRSLPRQALELVEKRGEGLSPYLRRTQAERRGPPPRRAPQEHSHERRCLCPLRPERKHCLKLVEFLLGRVL